MRDITFRGKHLSSGRWVYGCLNRSPTFKDDTTIYEWSASLSQPVDPNTVGQYTGLKDKNGKKIFEGDILKLNHYVMEVFWGELVGDGYGFQWRSVNNGASESLTGFIDEYEIIGNIHDNPSLLDGDE